MVAPCFYVIMFYNTFQIQQQLIGGYRAEKSGKNSARDQGCSYRTRARVYLHLRQPERAHPSWKAGGDKRSVPTPAVQSERGVDPPTRKAGGTTSSGSA